MKVECKLRSGGDMPTPPFTFRLILTPMPRCLFLERLESSFFTFVIIQTFQRHKEPDKIFAHQHENHAKLNCIFVVVLHCKN